MYVSALACACDAPARAMVLNFKQFNGKYGCSYCLHPGEVIDDTNTRTYPFNGESQCRTHAQSMRLAIKAWENQQMNARTQDSSEYEVKGLTEVYLLQRFDIIEGFSCDYMHSCLLGVTRQFVFLWCESTGLPYYLG